MRGEKHMTNDKTTFDDKRTGKGTKERSFHTTSAKAVSMDAYIVTQEAMPAGLTSRSEFPTSGASRS
jgi:hypothetical protein